MQVATHIREVLSGMGYQLDVLLAEYLIQYEAGEIRDARAWCAEMGISPDLASYFEGEACGTGAICDLSSSILA